MQMRCLVMYKLLLKVYTKLSNELGFYVPPTQIGYETRSTRENYVSASIGNTTHDDLHFGREFTWRGCKSR